MTAAESRRADDVLILTSQQLLHLLQFYIVTRSFNVELLKLIVYVYEEKTTNERRESFLE